MFGALRTGAIDRVRYERWMLMRRVIDRGGAVIGVARDRAGRVLRVGVLRRAPERASARAGAALAVPMLQD
jgi:hypothetical protein